MKSQVKEKTDSSKLASWYLEHQRPLPWRVSKDPYKIWISEVMLQQTTVAAVIPYYERFIERFPDLRSLSDSTLEDVLPLWSGLGYYSRCRNLHKAAQELAKLKNFPQKSSELIKYPGFGPYTARAVSSLAFLEPVGVLDGNVIRVLCRKYGLQVEWWKPQGRILLQTKSDELVQGQNSSVVNQGLMELGATVCTPKKPNCVLCPWNKNCVALKQNLIQLLPLKAPKRKTEIWLWKPLIFKSKNKVLMAVNDYAPFLKGQWLFPGGTKKLSSKPKRFHLKHSITHHDIFIQVEIQTNKPRHQQLQNTKWIARDQIKKINPTSIVQKILKHVEME